MTKEFACKDCVHYYSPSDRRPCIDCTHNQSETRWHTSNNRWEHKEDRMWKKPMEQYLE